MERRTPIPWFSLSIFPFRRVSSGLDGFGAGVERRIPWLAAAGFHLWPRGGREARRASFRSLDIAVHFHDYRCGTYILRFSATKEHRGNKPQINTDLNTKTQRPLSLVLLEPWCLKPHPRRSGNSFRMQAISIFRCRSNRVGDGTVAADRR